MANTQRFTQSQYTKDYGFSINDVRRANLSDLQLLEKLVTRSTFTLFGNIDPSEKLDGCYKSMCLQDQHGKAVAFICLNDHPNVPSIPPWEWSHWLYNIYHLDTVTPRNSLWIHLVVWDKQFTYAFVTPMLKAVFAEDSFLEYVVMVVPPGIHGIDWLEGQGTRIVPPGFYDSHKVQTLYLLPRQNFVTKYKIRRAVEEDNDDLVPLIHTYSERLQENYGEFYVAEILTRYHDCGRQLIVAEYNEQAVAVLFLNSAVNFTELNQSFELVPYYGLQKEHENDEIERSILGKQMSEVAAETLEVDEDIRSLESAHFQKSQEDTSDDFYLAKEEKQIEEREQSDQLGIEPCKSKETGLGMRTESEDFADDFSIVDVPSAHFLIDFSDNELKSQGTLSSCDYSAMMLSDHAYKMQLYIRRSSENISEDGYVSSKHTLFDHRQLTQVPTFYGESNAFTLEIAAGQLEHELEALSLLLEAAFECFPDRDYCILALPSKCPPFKLYRYFTRVPPRPSSTYPHDLYVLHRNSILSTMSVRVAIKSDIAAVEQLVSNIAKSGSMILDFILAVSEDKNLQAYLLLSEDQIVGVSVIREQRDFEYLKSHYELIHWLDEYHHKAGSHGLIEHFILSPIFRKLACFFLREVHRLSDYSVLYYCVSPSDTSSALRTRSLCCVVSDLIGVRPRPTPEFNHSDLEGCMPPDVVHRIDPPFALYVSTSRHCSLPRYKINNKIVVVGSSDIAIGFLESLICSWSHSYHVIFSNVTVVSPHGISYEKPDNKVRDMMFVTKNNYNYRYLNLISLRTYVNHVSAVMTGIQRKDKLLIVNNNGCLTYDLLFLMCGKQFQKPRASAKDKKQKGVTQFPVNVFLINTDTDATRALIKLKKFITERIHLQYTVLVYGHALEAFCCMAALREFGVPPQYITFVESFPNTSEHHTEIHTQPFPDPDVDEAVHANITTEGITIYQSYYFADWFVDKDTNHVTSVKFESRTRRIVVDCIAMFMYNDRTVSAKTFMAINKAGLVFDGGLVIGPDCRTNDPNIYAAGTMTKYSRRFYAGHLKHKYFNQEEIGTKLGKQMRKRLIPCFDEDVDWNPIYCEPGNMLVPVYEKPLVTYCRLPGNLRYLYVTKPGKPVPLEVAMSSNDYGQIFVTGDCRSLEKQGYFRIHLNEHGVVETITCLAKFDIDRKNLTSLWGKHESLLNNLQTRFQMMLISDLFEYFRQPWCCAIYHDRFSLLEKSIKELLTCITPTEGNSPIEELLALFKANNWNKLTDDENRDITEKFAASPYHTLLEQKVMDFLRDNITFLPMYAHPLIIHMLLQGCENSPLFEPQ